MEDISKETGHIQGFILHFNMRIISKIENQYGKQNIEKLTNATFL